MKLDGPEVLDAPELRTAHRFMGTDGHPTGLMEKDARWIIRFAGGGFLVEVVSYPADSSERFNFIDAVRATGKYPDDAEVRVLACKALPTAVKVALSSAMAADGLG